MGQYRAAQSFTSHPRLDFSTGSRIVPGCNPPHPTVAEYLKALPEDRRKVIEAVRQVMLDSLDADYEEGMQYGMIGYAVPLRMYPAGYHCDPKQPLPFAGLVAEKSHLSLHFMCLYGDETREDQFRKAWEKTGRKLEMGRCCVRFKRLEDLALDVIADLVRGFPARKYIAAYEALRAQTAAAAAARKQVKAAGSESAGAGSAKSRKRA